MLMVPAADLESRQSEKAVNASLEIGWSPPRIWNQGKARAPSYSSAVWMVPAADLESRQSWMTTVSLLMQMVPAADLESRQSNDLPQHWKLKDGPRRGFGIKAKRGEINLGRRGGMVPAADLESRQSSGRFGLASIADGPRRGFGIKAKLDESEYVPNT